MLSVFRLLGTLALVVALPCAAQPFADDFETKLLRTDAPAGPWDSLFYVGLPGQSLNNFRLELSPLAAHRGTKGFRVTDNHTGSGSSASGFVSRLFPAGGATSHYARFWVRPGTSNGAGTFSFFGFASDALANYTASEVRWNTASGALEFNCVDRTGRNTQFGAVPMGAEWRLVELALERQGTNAAQCLAWVDGQWVGSQSVDLTGVVLTHVTLGEHYAPLAVTAVLDVDDLAVELSPPASRLALSADAVQVGACTPLTVSLAQSHDGGAAAPAFATAVTLTEDAGAVTFWSDAACTASATGVELAPSETTRVMYLKASSAGAFGLSAESVDVLPANLSLTATGDSVRPNLYAISCGCDGAANGLGALFAAAALGLRLTARRRP